MQYQLISYTITLQRRGEQSSYIKANSYMKGLSHSNKHCMWSCNCGGCRVAWEWLTIHYHTLDSHSSKVQHILDDCPLPCTAVVDAYADEACSQLSSLAVCMTAAREALVKVLLCYTHLCTMTWWLNELQLQSKLWLNGCASPHRGCPSSDRERGQMTVAHTQTGRGKSKLFNVTCSGHSWFSDLNSIGVSEQCFLAPSMVWKPARSATSHATRLTTDSSASHLRVFFSHWIIHPTVRLRSTRNLRCRSRGAFPAGFRLTVTERENISLIGRAQNS